MSVDFSLELKNLLRSFQNEHNAAKMQAILDSRLMNRLILEFHALDAPEKFLLAEALGFIGLSEGTDIVAAVAEIQKKHVDSKLSVSIILETLSNMPEFSSLVNLRTIREPLPFDLDPFQDPVNLLTALHRAKYLNFMPVNLESGFYMLIYCLLFLRRNAPLLGIKNFDNVEPTLFKLNFETFI
jgi:hypothetical protein